MDTPGDAAVALPVDPQVERAKAWVMRELGLRPDPTAGRASFAYKHGHTYWVKARVVEHVAASTSWDLPRIDVPFDYLLGILVSPRGMVLGAVEAPRDVVEELGHQTAASFRFRWNRQVADDPRVVRVLWRSDVGGADDAGSTRGR